MSLERRIDALEGACSTTEWPNIIFISHGPDGEIWSAIIIHGDHIARGHDESEETFVARAEACAANIE